MRFVDIIRKKRDGEVLSRREIEYLVEASLRNEIPDYQLSAFFMAVFFKGMNINETVHLTNYMMQSGDVLNWSFLNKPTVDKHSTGGVGDKISIPLAPLVASTGLVAVPMISGRALGHTGGTLDKLESIKGYRTNLSLEEFQKIVSEVGCSIVGQTEKLVPADRKFYAIRDATATVENISLISSSIMSKKLAEGVEGIVLDVKTGSGAFMRKYRDAKELATLMVEIGKRMGRKVVALITNMDQPLGYAVGNAVEILESLDILRGQGPEDVKELVLTLGAYMLKISGRVENLEDARKILKENMYNGEGLKTFRRMVKLHGGDWDYIHSREFTQTKFIYYVSARGSGYIGAYNTYAIGLASTILGAGRSRMEDAVDHRVGIILRKKVGDKVEDNETIFEVRANDEAKLSKAIELLENSYKLVRRKPQKQPLIFEVIE